MLFFYVVLWGLRREKLGNNKLGYWEDNYKKIIWVKGDMGRDD